MPLQKQFDVQKALDSAMDVFWTNGYEATSMQDLLQCMGINRGSFYDTFGCKHDLFLEALRRFDQMHREDEFRVLSEKESAREAIISLFQHVTQECTCSAGKKGCFLVNTALELSPRDKDAAAIVQQAFHDTELFFRRLIRRGQKQGEIPATVKPTQTARALLALLIGMRVLARASSPREVLVAIAREAEELLQ